MSCKPGAGGHPPMVLSPLQTACAYASGAFGFSYLYMALFLVPLRASELGAPPAAIGLIVGAGELLPALLAVSAGALVDRFGARRVYVVSTLLTAACALLIAITPSYWLMLPLQMAGGLARSTAETANQTYITSVAVAAGRPSMVGGFAFSSNGGTLLGPLLVGVVAELAGYATAFVFLGLFAALFGAIGLALPPIGGARPSAAIVRAGGPLGDYRRAAGLLGRRGVQFVILLSVTGPWIVSGWRAFYPLYLVEHGFGPALIGSVLATAPIVAMVASLLAAPLCRVVSKAVALAGAMAFSALGIALAPYLPALPWVYAPALLIGTANGFGLPLMLSLVSDHTTVQERGLAMGLRMAATRVSGTVTPIFLGALVALAGLTTAFGAHAAVAWLIIALGFWRRPLREQPGSGAPAVGGGGPLRQAPDGLP